LQEVSCPIGHLDGIGPCFHKRVHDTRHVLKTHQEGWLIANPVVDGDVQASAIIEHAIHARFRADFHFLLLAGSIDVDAVIAGKVLDEGLDFIACPFGAPAQVSLHLGGGRLNKRAIQLSFDRNGLPPLEDVRQTTRHLHLDEKTNFAGRQLSTRQSHIGASSAEGSDLNCAASIDIREAQRLCLWQATCHQSGSNVAVEIPPAANWRVFRAASAFAPKSVKHRVGCLFRKSTESRPLAANHAKLGNGTFNLVEVVSARYATCESLFRSR
jgi:hypothetical protein